jgi:hypothetical protein
MKQMKMIRVADTGKATFSVFLDEGIPFAVTLERPWMNNQKSISCIPVGKYRVLRCRKSPDYGSQDSPRFGNTFQVFNVPGRGNILFHKGNIAGDTHGCITVGESFDPVSQQDGIVQSGKGFAEFLQRTAEIDEFELEIVRAF